jgi:hypothetical protein
MAPACGAERYRSTLKTLSEAIIQAVAAAQRPEVYLATTASSAAP